ncbi:MAG: hypothetical protein IMZ62_14160 [Chloroflexi bacterium]|nr:hypothetical protein [Chloroflexota bacterium]
MGNITTNHTTQLDAADVVQAAVAAELEIVEEHLHPILQELYGGTDATDSHFVADSTMPISIVSGTTNLYGTEKQLTRGANIGSGDPAILFDMDSMIVSDVSHANKPCVVILYNYLVGDAAAGSHYHKVISKEKLCSTLVCAANAANSDSFSQPIRNRRLPCNTRLSIVSKCADTVVTIKSHFVLHVYPA